MGRQPAPAAAAADDGAEAEGAVGASGLEASLGVREGSRKQRRPRFRGLGINGMKLVGLRSLTWNRIARFLRELRELQAAAI